MEMITGILLSLGVNSTFWIQLSIFVVMFFFLKKVVFDPYFKAFEKRQEKTTGSQNEAEMLYAQTRELQALYQRKARNINADIKAIFDKIRGDANREQDTIISQAKEKSKLDSEKTREKIQGEFNKAREALIKEAPILGEAINNKLIGRDA
jgi:F-type H+-transporting ATPase subunit b